MAAAPLANALPAAEIPVGLELYSVRKALAADLPGTVRAVAKLGYQVVEFYAPYFAWTPDYARQVRGILDDSGLLCKSTHNSIDAYTGDGIQKAIELNRILGATYIVLASAPKMDSANDWRRLCDQLSATQEKFRAAQMLGGYHNHELEFTPMKDGALPMKIIAASTPKDFALQLDVGTCVAAGADSVAWIRSNPGRIRSMHCKDWLPGHGYSVLTGDGAAPWQHIFDAAESVGGIEYYLIEQEGSEFSEMETVKRCLANWRGMRPGF
ncbi:MAG TPA: sugar phosphate isomerase/epimerase [Candidatus Limnocylindrales bacterium]|nr:sugar phosphate isomerase/epimerase [Candidatus Limnocylindrales bacterium]